MGFDTVQIIQFELFIKYFELYNSNCLKIKLRENQ